MSYLTEEVTVFLAAVWACLYRGRVYFTLMPNWLKWTSNVFMRQYVGTPPIFLSSFSFHAWHGWREWMEQEAGCGRKKMTPTSPTWFVWNVAVSGVCMCVRPVTSSPTAPDYWMESTEAACLYSLCLQLVRLLIQKERDWQGGVILKYQIFSETQTQKRDIQSASQIPECLHFTKYSLFSSLPLKPSQLWECMCAHQKLWKYLRHWTVCVSVYVCTHAFKRISQRLKYFQTTVSGAWSGVPRTQSTNLIH